MNIIKFTPRRGLFRFKAKNFSYVINKKHIDFVELRSDVKTLPTMKMRESVLFEEFGDNAKFEDEVVTRLEKTVANLLGKEKGMYVPSGTMGNYACLLQYANSGDYIIQGDICHIHKIELISQKLLGLKRLIFKNKPDATLDISEESLLDLIAKNGNDKNFIKSIKGVCLENTHNFLGGKLMPIDFINKLRNICENVSQVHKDFKPKFHLDGSRILNAASALNIDPKVLCKGFDTINMCLSKGVGAPIGSVICFDEENGNYAKAAEIRRGLGGTMRQSGFAAAPALVALEDWRERFPIDHRRAHKLYEGIKNLKGLKVVKPETNIINIFFEEKYDHLVGAFTDKLKEKHNVLVYNMFNGEYIRLVTHHQVLDHQVDIAINGFKQVSEELFNLV